MSKTVLITGIGGDVAQGVATIVRETFPEWRVIGMDIHERHGGVLFADIFHVAPRVDDSSYDGWLEALIAREGVDLVLPTSEAELIHLSCNNVLSIGGAAIVMANRKALEVGSDKLTTAEFLSGAGISAPRTIAVDAFGPDFPLPCIFKPRRSAGSKSVFVCRSKEDVAFYKARHPAAILQELLEPADREVTCAVYRGRSGTAVLQLLRTLVGGFTGWAQVINDDEISLQCTRVAEAIELRGSINVQLRLTPSGPRIFEINPRFSSTVLIRHRMGFTDAVWQIREALGQAVAYHQPHVGTIGVRVQGAALAGTGKAIP